MNRAFSLGIVALLSIGAESASASLITWKLDGTLNSGTPFSAVMTLDTETENVSQDPASSGYFGVFNSFDLFMGTSHLTLDPSLVAASTDVPLAQTETNYLVTLRQPSRYIFLINSHLQEGSSDFVASFLFNFSDTAVFPTDSIAPSPPSLDTATVRDFSLYQPLGNGAGIRIASGTINSFIQLPVAVPEPGTLALFGVGLLGVAFARRRMVS